MQDAIIAGTGNSRYLKSNIASTTTFAQFLTAIRAGTLPIDLNGTNSAGFTQQGTPLNTANLLSSTTASSLSLSGSNATVDKALANYANHKSNTTVHVSTDDRTAWNGKANNTDLTSHTGNTSIHVTSTQKTNWTTAYDKVTGSTVPIGSSSSATGTSSIAIGASSNAASNTAIAIGYDSNANNSNNNGTLAIGLSASNTGRGVCIGSEAVLSGGMGSLYGSVVIGDGANDNSSGNSCVVIGGGSGARSSSTAIGAGAQALGGSGVAIGTSANVATTDNNTIQLGTSSTSALRCQVQLTVQSDKRDKSEIETLNASDALDLIKGVMPISYHRNPRSMYIPDFAAMRQAAYEAREKLAANEQLSARMEEAQNAGVDWRDASSGSEFDADAKLLTDEEIGQLHDAIIAYDESVEHKAYQKYGLCKYDTEAHKKGTKKGSRLRFGVMAQQVQETLGKVYGDRTYGNIVNDNFNDLTDEQRQEASEMGAESSLTVNYEGFIPMLIAAMQAQQKQIDSQQKQIESMKALLANNSSK